MRARGGDDNLVIYFIWPYRPYYSNEIAMPTYFLVDDYTKQIKVTPKQFSWN